MGVLVLPLGNSSSLIFWNIFVFSSPVYDVMKPDVDVTFYDAAIIS